MSRNISISPCHFLNLDKQIWWGKGILKSFLLKYKFVIHCIIKCPWFQQLYFSPIPLSRNAHCTEVRNQSLCPPLSLSLVLTLICNKCVTKTGEIEVVAKRRWTSNLSSHWPHLSLVFPHTNLGWVLSLQLVGCPNGRIYGKKNRDPSKLKEFCQNRKSSVDTARVAELSTFLTLLDPVTEKVTFSSFRTPL